MTPVSESPDDDHTPTEEEALLALSEGVEIVGQNIRSARSENDPRVRGRQLRQAVRDLREYARAAEGHARLIAPRRTTRRSYWSG